MRSITRLRLQARALRRTTAVGEPWSLQVLLVNDGPEPVLVLPCLPGSTMGLGRKLPAISMIVKDGAGEEVLGPIAGSFWGAARLRGAQFRRLVPGESLDLFAEGEGAAPAMFEFSPAEPGTYTARFTYDVRGPTAEDWTTDEGLPDDEALQLLPHLPRGRFETDPVKITVTDRK